MNSLALGAGSNRKRVSKLDCASLLTTAIHSLALAIMSAVSGVSYAAGTIVPTFTPAAPPIVKYYSWASSHLYADTPEEACAIFAAQEAVNWIGGTPWLYHHIEPYNENVIACFATNPPSTTVTWLAQIPIKRSCDGLVWSNVAITCATNTCPANSIGTPAINPTTCTCNDGYEPDPTRTSCVPVTPCPVAALTPLPANDACTQALENISTTQAQKNTACGTLTSAMLSGKSCLESKLANLATPVPLVVTADIRSIAYQAHLREIWDKMEDLVELEDDPAKQAACAARRAEIAAEKGCDNAGKCMSCYTASVTQRSHCLKARPANPSPNDAQHTQGKAIDVSEARTIAPLQSYLSAVNPPQNVQQFLDAPTNCNLNWGGTFVGNPDPVHFYVP